MHRGMIEENVQLSENNDPMLLIEELIKQVIQEKLSPDIMPYQHNLVS